MGRAERPGGFVGGSVAGGRSREQLCPSPPAAGAAAAPRCAGVRCPCPSSGPCSGETEPGGYRGIPGSVNHTLFLILGSLTDLWGDEKKKRGRIKII